MSRNGLWDVFPFIIGIPMLVSTLTDWLNLPSILSILSVPTGIIVAWIWWSVRVPQWRVWALKQTEDIEILHQKAVQVGIEWPYGHIFEKTEIKSIQLSEQEVSLQLFHYLRLLEQRIWNIGEVRYPEETHKKIQYAISQLREERLLLPHILQDIERDLKKIASQGSHSEIVNGALFATIFFISKYRHIFNLLNTGQSV